MREIKFRVWDNLNHRMREVNEIGFINRYVWTKTDTTPLCLSDRQYELMQYTGFKDNNGKEIYEGDILKVVDPNGDALPNWAVEWHKAGCYPYEDPNGFDGFDITSLGWAMDMGYSFEVIGNIFTWLGYENQEGASPPCAKITGCPKPTINETP